MGIQRQPGESALAYHKRLIYGKLVDRTLADVDYSELSELVYGQPYSSDNCRKAMYGSKKTLELMDAEGVSHIADDALLSELESKKIEIQKERQKFFDERTAFNKIVRERSRQEELNEILVDAIQHSDLPKLNYEPHVSEYSDNDLLVSLNDIHYGANVKNAWNEYNSDICRKMFSNYLDKIISIQKRHGSQNCYVWSNGDAIHGNLKYSIAVTNKENVIEQIMGVSELISEFLSELSLCFDNVYFVTVGGNHSRLNPNKDQSLYTERLDDLIEWYVKARLQDYVNVTILDARIDETMYVFEVRGKNYLGCHGDYESGEAKIQTLQAMSGKQIYAVLLGHKHHNKIDNVQNIKTVMAGSFLGVDSYCVTKRIIGRPEQLVCVCDGTGIICYYDIPLADK